jgi:hypothetical protein
MSDRPFTRPMHREVLAVLSRFDRAYLARAECYFGGGTRIVLELGEYRESRDIDFLCASRDGYRTLREAVSEKSLGPILKSPLPLARGIRADQYGIRTVLGSANAKLKLEIIREARIDLEGAKIAGLPVPCLTRAHAFAEKFLANADRGLDASTLSRDVVDLAFMTEGWSSADRAAGLDMARAAYGESVNRALAAVTRKMREDRKYRSRCVDELGISDTKTLSSGLAALAGVSSPHRHGGPT